MPPCTVQSRAAIHRFLRLGSEKFPGPEGCGSPAQTGARSVKYLRLFLAIYGAGIAGTFAWRFFRLSGTTTCASSTESCQIVIGRTGQLALVWPAYWSGRISGNGAMTPLVSVEAVAVAALVFFGAPMLALAYTRTARAGPEPLRGEPKRRTNEPSRRDQSQPSNWARGARSF